MSQVSAEVLPKRFRVSKEPGFQMPLGEDNESGSGNLS